VVVTVVLSLAVLAVVAIGAAVLASHAAAGHSLEQELEHAAQREPWAPTAAGTRPAAPLVGTARAA
jgi:hypothetical protein